MEDERLIDFLEWALRVEVLPRYEEVMKEAITGVVFIMNSKVLKSEEIYRQVDEE